MNLLTLLSLLICLQTIQSAGSEHDACFQNGYSPECTAIIRLRHNLTVEDLERLQSQIKSLADSDRLRITENGPYSPFNMAMGCYAIGQRLPSDNGCASCLNCEQQLSSDVCGLFCPPIPSPSPPVPSVSLPSIAPSTTVEPEKASIVARQEEPVRPRERKLDFTTDPLTVMLIVLGVLLIIPFIYAIGLLIRWLNKRKATYHGVQRA